MPNTLNDQHRTCFVDELRLLSGLEDDDAGARVLHAFGRVPRERFVGPGPWTVRSPLYNLVTTRTPDDDPRHLYHCVLVALDEKQGINIGEPSMWARLLSRTDVAAGSRVLQVGAGSGYYTAILKELVGDGGSILAMETDERLAQLATDNLAGIQGIKVRHGNAATELADDDGPFDLVIAFAGVTHPVDAWTDRLTEGGRMLLPVTGSQGWGGMMLLSPSDTGFDVVTLGFCSFYPCEGARNDDLAKRLDAVWRDRTRLDGWKMAIRTDGGRLRYEVDGQSF